MLKIGLTGGIGSGKSCVANLFSNLGIPVIDADAIARKLLETNVTITQQIIQHFGDKLINNEGLLDRNQLRKIIFSDQVQRHWLEELLHPLIILEIQNLLKNLKDMYCIIVIPLLIEATLPYSLVDRILLVDAPEKLQIERTIARDAVTEAEVKQILDSQAKRTQRLEVADDVIVNDQDLAYLVEEVNHWHDLYLELADIDK